jgi:hypothetical protein
LAMKPSVLSLVRHFERSEKSLLALECKTECLKSAGII